MNDQQHYPDPVLTQDAVNRPVVVTETAHPRVSWGAIIAGSVITLSLGWLLYLLGAAFGVSIADAMDSANMEGGLAIGATIWIVLSWMVAFFIGSMATARLAGIVDDFSGMLHGFVLWGLATIVTVVLGSYGVSSLFQTGQQLASGAAQGVAAAGTQVAQGTGYAAQGVSYAAQELTASFGDNIQDRLSDQAAEIAASSQEQLSEQEMRNVINSLDERTLRRVVQDLANNDQEGAAQLMADSTELSEQDAQALVSAAYRELEEQFGNPENAQSLSADLKNQFSQQIDSYVATLDARGGADVSEQDVRKAVNSLDAAAVQSIAIELADGDSAGAKRILAQNTSLSTEQINELYEGAMNGIEQEAEEFSNAVNETVETVSTYTQQVLWIAFAASAMALAVSLLGGWLGADTHRRYREETVA